MNVRIFLAFTVLMASSMPGRAQDFNLNTDEKISPFLAYEFGEAIFNRFQSFSGEIGLSFPNKHLIRLVHQNVQLTEAHLSSNFASIVKGDNVEGSLFGFEALYSFPLYRWKNDCQIIYISPSVGYHQNGYSHLILEEAFEKSSMTAGLELALRETDLFGIRGLYYALTIPTRIHFSSHDAFTLGDTQISSNRFDNNIWLFIGYQF